MKKIYLIPNSTVIELEITQHILDSSVTVNGSTGSVRNGGDYTGGGTDIFGRGNDGDDW